MEYTKQYIEKLEQRVIALEAALRRIDEYIVGETLEEYLAVIRMIARAALDGKC